MKPEFAIVSEHKRDNITRIVINTSKAKYQGIKWSDLGDFGKRKFDNILTLSRMPERVKASYV